MSVSYLYARNREKWEKEKLFQGPLGEEVGALCSLEGGEVGALCSDRK